MSRKWIMILVSSAAVLMIGAVAAVSYTPNEKAISAPPYAFAQLGVDCEQAASEYTVQAEKLNKDAATYSTELSKQIESTSQMITSNANSGVSDIGRAKDQFWGLYLAGGVTKAEYDAKMVQLDQVAASTYTTPSNEFQAKLESIQREAQKSIDDIRAKAVGYNDNASKLNTCATSAKNEEVFSFSDRADIQLMIDKLYKVE